MNAGIVEMRQILNELRADGRVKTFPTRNLGKVLLSAVKIKPVVVNQIICLDGSKYLKAKAYIEHILKF